VNLWLKFFLGEQLRQIFIYAVCPHSGTDSARCLTSCELFTDVMRASCCTSAGRGSMFQHQKGVL